MGLADSLNILSMDAEYFEDIIFRLPGAEQIAGYYDMLYDVAGINDTKGRGRFHDLACNIRECHRYWFFDHFRQQAVKDRRKVFMCHNKFCTNCQKIFAQVRKRKFGPAIDKFAEEYDLYHMVFTLPNCTGVPLSKEGLVLLTDSEDNGLKKTIRHMAGCFQVLVRYLSGRARIKGIDFTKYGFAGCIRSLECSFKRYGTDSGDDVYHPHYHVIAAFKRGLEFEKKHLNQYSYSRRGGKVRMFSDFELLIQKIWRLLIDGKKVTGGENGTIFAMKNDEGYSCMSDKIAPGNYHEVFKYAIKLDKVKRSAKKKEDRLYIPLRNFIEMHYALYNVRTIQGYGIFHNMKFEDVNLDDIVDKIYYEVRHKLVETEKPAPVFEFPADILKNIREGQVYISKNNIRSLLRASGLTRGTADMIGPENISFGFASAPPREPERPEAEQLAFYDGNGIMCHEDFEQFYTA